MFHTLFSSLASVPAGPGYRDERKAHGPCELRRSDSFRPRRQGRPGDETAHGSDYGRRGPHWLWNGSRERPRKPTRVKRRKCGQKRDAIAKPSSGHHWICTVGVTDSQSGVGTPTGMSLPHGMHCRLRVEDTGKFDEADSWWEQGSTRGKSAW